MPLRLLRLLLKHGEQLASDFDSGLAGAPARAWRGVVPQLLARLAHPEPSVRQHVKALLVSIGSSLPQLVLYPVLVGVETADGGGVEAGGAEAGGASARPELLAICRELQAQAPQLVSELKLVISELRRITLLWEEQTMDTLKELQVPLASASY